MLWVIEKNAAGNASTGCVNDKHTYPLPPTPRFHKHVRISTQIGATPTVSNCRTVLKEMPLESCSITAAWRSRGGLADAIIIQPNGQKCGGGGGGLGGKERGGGGAKIGDAPPPPSLESPLKGSVAHAASVSKGFVSGCWPAVWVL